jgi:putative DNA primase/helicase
VVLHCHHVGKDGAPTCTTEDIVSALGLTLADLYDDGPGSNGTAGSRKSKPAPKTYPTWEAAAAAVAFRLGVPGPAGSWKYADLEGKPAMVVARFNLPDGSKEFRPISPCAGGWKIGDPPGLLPLYNLPAVARSGEAVVVEGEKCTDALAAFGYVTTTAPHGAKSPAKCDWTPLAGKAVVILPDHDGPGEGYARGVLAELARLDPRPRVKVVRLPNLVGHLACLWP